MSIKVAVLLASFNGERYIKEQIKSILAQVDVEPYLIISDDGSTDRTLHCIAEVAPVLVDRLSILNGCKPYELFDRCSAHNFYNLIHSVDLPSDLQWVAFSDQDDIWHPDHLIRAIRLIEQRKAAGYSSSVMAFWPNGRTRLVKKCGQISRYNHLFESPGPGCSFVLPRASFDSLQSHLRKNLLLASRIIFHDWAIFAYIRSIGGSWVIDPTPSLLYRQHDSNVIGVQLTPHTISKRLGMLFGCWYRDQCLAVAAFAGQTTAGPVRRLRRFNWLDRFALALMVFVHRRRLRDKLLFYIAFLFMKLPVEDRDIVY
jgi:rhamnosyltransferase